MTLQDKIITIIKKNDSRILNNFRERKVVSNLISTFQEMKTRNFGLRTKTVNKTKPHSLFENEKSEQSTLYLIQLA